MNFEKRSPSDPEREPGEIMSSEKIAESIEAFDTQSLVPIFLRSADSRMEQYRKEVIAAFEGKEEGEYLWSWLAYDLKEADPEGAYPETLEGAREYFLKEKE